MKTLTISLIASLLIATGSLAYGAEVEQHAAPTTEAGVPAVQASAVVPASSANNNESLHSNGQYWLEAHTSVKVDDQYQWVIAAIMCFVVLFMLEEGEEHKKKKKHRR